MEEARVEGGDLGGDAHAQICGGCTSGGHCDARLKHNALIVCITPHPCLFYCRNDHTGPPKVQSRSSFVIYSSGEPPHVFAIARS